MLLADCQNVKRSDGVVIPPTVVSDRKDVYFTESINGMNSGRNYDFNRPVYHENGVLPAHDKNKEGYSLSSWGLFFVNESNRDQSNH